MRKKIFGTVIFSVAAAFVAFAAGCRIVNDLIFQPNAFRVAPSAEMTMLDAGENVRIALLPSLVPDAKYLILYSHGNAETLFDLTYRFRQYNAHGFSVLGYDYRGYGASGGEPSEENCYADIEKVYEYAVETLKFPPERIIIYGRSLGCGPSAELALRRPAAGLVLESGFTSACTVVLSFSPPGDPFANLDKMPRLKLPVLIVHGEKDDIIPISHAEKNFAALTGEKYFFRVPEAGHNRVLSRGGKAYWKAVGDFAAALEKRTDKTSEPAAERPEQNHE